MTQKSESGRRMRRGQAPALQHGFLSVICVIMGKNTAARRRFRTSGGEIGLLDDKATTESYPLTLQVADVSWGDNWYDAKK